jgi:hypothetical protein
MATKNIQLTLPPKNAPAWDNPLNGNFTIIDSVFGGTLNIALSGSDYYLKTTETQNLRIQITGALGASDLSLVFPDGVGGSWIVTNNTSSSGGSVFVKTASFTVSPVKIERNGSLFVFSDGQNMYSATSGGSGNFLPLTGGTISGDLAINKTLDVTGLATFRGGLTVSNGQTTVGDLKITGRFDLATTNLSVGALSVNGYILTGAEKFGVIGTSTLNGDVSISSGNVTLATGGLIVRGSNAGNILTGTTTIPQSSSFTVKTGASFTIENGASVNIAGSIKPNSIETATATITTATITTDNITTANIGTANISGILTAKRRAVFEAGLEGGDSSTFTDLIVDSTGYASLHFSPGDPNIGAVTSCTTEAQPRFGMWNEKVSGLALGAWLNMATGRWTATGGVGVGIKELPSTITNVPGVLYEDNDQTFADVGKVIAHLYAEISALRSELSAIKSGNTAP